MEGLQLKGKALEMEEKAVFLTTRNDKKSNGVTQNWRFGLMLFTRWLACIGGIRWTDTLRLPRSMAWARPEFVGREKKVVFSAFMLVVFRRLAGWQAWLGWRRKVGGAGCDVGFWSAGWRNGWRLSFLMLLIPRAG